MRFAGYLSEEKEKNKITNRQTRGLLSNKKILLRLFIKSNKKPIVSNQQICVKQHNNRCLCKYFSSNLNHMYLYDDDCSIVIINVDGDERKRMKRNGE